ncbi:hypothetical protein MGYG_02968 [Nannizzia gypsea CBS 118893]|uniref:Uncharacterized protein n=1 Tax=Arthroderma gypseum (strain ATCC MYA-4604 / CBS 118893) TaxID=535722 RepID=E4UQ41_ARTGP|nr:hypothetical protein MGYG_02968 [Nannizzia gypsea CBS 118893]EFQ99960.1 hypothetical protein MGYG_02968 [Nannizzia gypsea CBS 118893]
MGNKISAVSGVKSPNFYEPGNAVNEIWVGNLEIISRLPFGDSDMAQAGWPKNDYPKFPWRPFVIPLFAMFTKGAAAEPSDGTAAHLYRRSTPYETITTSTMRVPTYLISGFVVMYAVLTILFACTPMIEYLLETVYLKCRRSARDLLKRSVECLHEINLLGIYSKPYLIYSYVYYGGKCPTAKIHPLGLLCVPVKDTFYLAMVQLFSTIFAAVTCYGDIYRYCKEPRSKQADEMTLWQEKSTEIGEGNLDSGKEKSRPGEFASWVFIVNLCAIIEAVTTVLLLINLSKD